ncbi:ASCH domain-containing protein [Pedobacter gandavensis]|uniref:ASCH domain-containing protein n=1 Tax=Pedobacter gandavensis TaxID=2679963 RepID=A0ABR6EU56_9SPHI|nr:ASCH domain-containing protein [Pedobacter gandavensis]MBB2148795.1 ASCH domain-containing protein [Pedobacter gandavensis]
MKALSIKNPWAMLIAHGIKDIENRTWKTTHRGRIYIHSSAKSTGDNVVKLLNDRGQLMIISDSQYHSVIGRNPNSAIIGEVDIVDCVISHESIWAEKAEPGEKPIYNWVLTNPVLYDHPIENVKGALNLWNYSKP